MAELIETKAGARKRARRIYEQENGIKLGCHKVQSAKARNGMSTNSRQGVCLVCKQGSAVCVCDDRTAWVKGRVGAKL